jgi:NitT/TauT family transport system permease protein
MKNNKNRNQNYIWISTVLVLVLWWILAEIVDNQIKFPTPYDTAQNFIRIITDEDFFLMLFYSTRRLIIGFTISFAIGLILGLISGVSDAFYYFIKPIILTLRSVPTMAVILLSLIWLSREISPILVVSLVVFPIIYSAVVNGIRNVDKQLLEMTSIYKLSRKRKIFHLYLPSIRSSLASVLAAAISLNVKISIAAEVLSQPKYGIGTGFQMEKYAINTAGVLAWTIIAVVIAGFFEWLIKKLFKRYANVDSKA